MTLCRPSATLSVLLAMALCLVGLGPCLASTYIVNPVSMTLNSGEPQGQFRLVNEDDHPIRIEIAVKTWSQENSQNVERDTTDLIVSPKICVIAAHSNQIVRVGLRNIDPVGAERSYRLLFQDLGDPSEDVSAPGTTRVDYSVPVFLSADTPAGPKLEYTLKKTDASTLTLSIANHGDVHEKLILTALNRGTADPTSDDDILDPEDVNVRHYVLAGATVELKLHPRMHIEPGEMLSLDVLISGKHMVLPLTVQ